MQQVTGQSARLRAIGQALALAAGLQCSHSHALEKSAMLSVQLMLNSPGSCTTSLLAPGLGLGLVSADCLASGYQLSLVRPGLESSAIRESTSLGVLQTDLDSGLLTSALQDWALVQTSKAWQSNRLSQDITYYELRVDY